MRDKPHSDTSARHFSKTKTDYKSVDQIYSYKGELDASSHSVIQGTVTWKTAYTSDQKDRRVSFELNIDKISKQEKIFELNRKDYKKGNTPDSSS